MIKSIESHLASVILPIYHQADHVEALVREYRETLLRLPFPFELLLVVNGSGDDSFAIARRLEREFKDVRVIAVQKKGWGRAVRRGLEEASGDILCYTNSARTYPEDLILFLLYASAHPDTVIKANRKIRNSTLRRFGSLLYNLECRMLFDLSYWDINGTPKVFPRNFKELLALSKDDDLIDLEFNVICRERNFSVLEVPIFAPRRHGGKSTTNIRSALRLYLGRLPNEPSASPEFTRSRMSPGKLDRLWSFHTGEWRHPSQVISGWWNAAKVDPRLLIHRVQGEWWDVLEEAGLTLVVSREYEHLLQALTVIKGKPHVTFLPLPHPSGMVVSPEGDLRVASTRNPNQIFTFRPQAGSLPRLDIQPQNTNRRPLMPASSLFLPGCLYIHDLAFINGKLFANSVGQNAVICVDGKDATQPVWWPRAIDTPKGPLFGRNHLQLNSIAAGKSLQASFFSASTDRVSPRRPGHKNFSVDKRGVLFSGKTREPVVSGLTRPHSARFYRGRCWLDNSGYGEVGFIENSVLVPVTRLKGWTRGLCFRDRVGFVGTSRVIAAYRCYAPGLEVDQSECGVHAIDPRTGRVRGKLIWPYGNQIFAIEALPANRTTGFPFLSNKDGKVEKNTALFYSYRS